MANKYISLDKLTKYHAKEVTRVDGLISTAKSEANAYADSLAPNYDAAGAASTAEANARAYADGKDTAIAEAKKAGTDAAAAASVADGKAVAAQTAADKAQGEVDALETYVGTFTHDTAKSVVEYINAKTDGIATSGNLEALGARVTTVEGDVANIKKDYLKASDKTELQGKIDDVQGEVDALEGTHATDKKALEDAIALKADQTALEAVSAVANAAVKQSDYDTKVKALEDEDARIVGLVEAEAERAAGVESGLEDRIETMEAFWEAAKADGDEGNVIDTLKEIQEYIAGDETGASEMLAAINKNKEDIAAHVAVDHDFATADATLKAELEGKIALKADKSAHEALDGRVGTAEGKITTVEGKVSTLEGQMTTVQGAVATKAEKTYVDDADTALSNRIATLEGKFTEGEGSVEDMIADAVGAEATRVDGLLDKKVDKVDGKGLSTNDLTNELKANYDAAYAHSQVAHAPADAQANVIESVKVNGSALTITGKAVDIAVPTDNAQLANGAGYLVASDIANKADKATTLAGYGIADTYTSAQTDTAIANAMAQFVECSEEDINALFA